MTDSNKSNCGFALGMRLFGPLILAVLLPTQAFTANLLNNVSGTETAGGSGYVGQSFTPPGNSSYSNITFSWLAGDGVTALATGTLYLLNQEYLGGPVSISPSTPGFIGQSMTISSNAYVFDPVITLFSTNKYWVYMGGNETISDVGYGYTPYAGGSAYEQFFSPFSPYISDDANNNPLDFNFILRGMGGPRLRITSTGHQISVGWTGSSTNYVLESKPYLSAVTNWEVVTNSITMVNQESLVIVSNRNAAQFFRLRYVP